MGTPDQITADAISDGLTWLTWMTQGENAEASPEEHQALLAAVQQMASALDAVRRGDVWASRKVQDGTLHDIEQLLRELKAKQAVEPRALDLARRVLGSFNL